jgi:hypothetical protein
LRADSNYFVQHFVDARRHKHVMRPFFELDTVSMKNDELI